MMPTPERLASYLHTHVWGRRMKDANGRENISPPQRHEHEQALEESDDPSGRISESYGASVGLAAEAQVKNSDVWSHQMADVSVLTAKRCKSLHLLYLDDRSRRQGHVLECEESLE